jgi:hypothetical protein
MSLQEAKRSQSSNTATEKVASSRRAIIQSILDMFHDYSKTLLDGDHCQQRTISAKDSIICDYVIFGSLCRAILKIRGSLLPASADDIAESVNEFGSFAQEVIGSIMCTSGHRSCNPAPKLEEILDKALLVSEQTIITPHHKLCMKNQRQKSGIEEPTTIQRRADNGKRSSK